MVIGILNLSQIFYACSSLLLPFIGRDSRLYAFSQSSTNIQAECQNVFCFPNGGAKQICVLSSSQIWSGFLHVSHIHLPAKDCFCYHQECTQWASHRVRSDCYDRHTECLDAVGQLRGSAHTGSPVTCQLPLEGVLNAVSRICIPSVCFKSLICSFPRFSCSPVMQLMTQYSGWVRERNKVLFCTYA